MTRLLALSAGALLMLTAMGAGAGETQNVVLIVSDGLDSGDAAGLERAMRALHRRSTVVWLHPRAGTLDFAPSASGMRAALPSIDLLAPAAERADFIHLARTLARRVRR